MSDSRAAKQDKLYQALLAEKQRRKTEATKYDWPRIARPEQLPPDWAWRTLLVLAGRGFGKTRLGCEQVRAWARTHKYVNLIGATADDARDIMIEGEALALETEIPTPKGWTTMGALSVGDTVFDGSAKPTQVKWVSDVAVDRPCFKVRFSNGESVVADASHKWAIYDLQSPFKRVIRTTQEMVGKIMHAPQGYRFSLEMHDGLDLPLVDLPLDPYVLGVWLGDGHTKGAAITTMDEEVLVGVAAAGFRTRAWPSSNSGRATTYGALGMKTVLRKMNLLWNKHVPDVYLRASRQQRMQLVRGLMDTDGYCSIRGQCEFSNTNERMIGSLRELLASLGIVHNVTIKDDPRGKRLWRIRFTSTQAIFSIVRKLERLSRDVKRVSIVAIEPHESVPVKCIAVSSEQSTFLFGRMMLPTHNSGLLRICPRDERPTYLPSKRRLEWPNGAVSLIFTADEPERFRGKQHEKLYADELAAWKYADEAWAQAMLGLRLGKNPQVIITTTPRPTKLIKEIVANPTTHVIRGTTYDNRANLAPQFFADIVKKYEGTRMGRQELNAEILTDNPNALWNRARIDELRVKDHPPLSRIVVAIDPAVTSNEDSDLTGIVVAGKAGDECFVLADLSLSATPDGWARIAVKAFHDFKADRIVAETNNGGDLVEAVLRTVDRHVPYRKIHASRGKQMRAEPIAALYEQGKVRHVGSFPQLEDEMCDFDPTLNQKSPDRMDACVWSLSELTQGPSRTGNVTELRI